MTYRGPDRRTPKNRAMPYRRQDDQTEMMEKLQDISLAIVSKLDSFVLFVPFGSAGFNVQQVVDVVKQELLDGLVRISTKGQPSGGR